VEPLTGKLLISNASLFDPSFRRTVVLVGHHDDEGAVGLVLNRSLGVTVHEAVPPLTGLVAIDEPVFRGGPVQPDAVVVVAEFDDPSVAEHIAFGRIGFLPDGLDRGEGGVRRARVFAGYSGWGPGQLEGELAEDAWIVTDAVPDDVFTDEPDRLWEGVLLRMGRAFDLLRLMPIDPSSN
jgi:putative transcriptional regulator